MKIEYQSKYLGDNHNNLGYHSSPAMRSREKLSSVKYTRVEIACYLWPGLFDGRGRTVHKGKVLCKVNYWIQGQKALCVWYHYSLKTLLNFVFLSRFETHAIWKKAHIMHISKFTITIAELVLFFFFFFCQNSSNFAVIFRRVLLRMLGVINPPFLPRNQAQL